MALEPTDYAILAATLGAGIFGLFGGLSGALALVAGLAVGSCAAKFGWPVLGAYFAGTAVRALVTTVVALVAFGLARVLVRKSVHGLLAQPGDAIFGALVASAGGAAAALGVVWGLRTVGVVELHSTLLQEVLAHVGG